MLYQNQAFSIIPQSAAAKNGRFLYICIPGMVEQCPGQGGLATLLRDNRGLSLI
jgi:hypothetical protein